MGVLKSPFKPAFKRRSCTRDKSPETTVSSLLLAQSGIEGPRTHRASTSATLPGLFRHATLPSLAPPEQLPSSAAAPLQPQQPAAQPAEHPPGPQLAKSRQSLFTGSPSGVELSQPRLLGLHRQPQLQRTVQQDQSRRANSEPRIQLPQMGSSDHKSQVGQIIRAGTGWTGTDSGLNGHVAPSLRRAHGESLEAERQYWAASQRLQQAKQREEALQFEQDMQLLSNRGDSDSSSSSGSVRRSGSEEGHLHQNGSAFHRQSASTSTSTQPSLRRGGNERQTPQHESLAFSKTTRPVLLTLRKETLPPADIPETTRGQDAREESKGDAEAEDREVHCDGESSLFAWLERDRRNRNRGGSSHYHLSSPRIKVKSEEREASYSAALKEERNSGDRPHYQDYDVLVEVPSSIGSESGSGTNASPQRRWRSPTPLPPKTGLHFSQGSPKTSPPPPPPPLPPPPPPPPPPAAAGTSRNTRHCSRGHPPSIPPRNFPRTRLSRSRVPRPRPYASPPNPPQPAMHSQRSTSPQEPRLFSRRFSDHLGSYPAVIFYTHIEHVENYYQRPHENRMQPDEELPSAEAEQSMEHDDHDAEAQPRGASPRL